MLVPTHACTCVCLCVCVYVPVCVCVRDNVFLRCCEVTMANLLTERTSNRACIRYACVECVYVCIFVVTRLLVSMLYVCLFTMYLICPLALPQLRGCQENIQRYRYTVFAFTYIFCLLMFVLCTHRHRYKDASVYLSVSERKMSGYIYIYIHICNTYPYMWLRSKFCLLFFCLLL